MSKLKTLQTTLGVFATVVGGLGAIALLYLAIFSPLILIAYLVLRHF